MRHQGQAFEGGKSLKGAGIEPEEGGRSAISEKAAGGKQQRQEGESKFAWTTEFRENLSQYSKQKP